MQEKIEKTIAALQKNNFEASYVESKEEVCNAILNLLDQENPVGVAGSLTVNQLGLLGLLTEKGYTYHTHSTGKSPAEMNEIKRKANSCDYYITSINAITEDGKLVNMDGSGNRVAAISYGPTKVIAVCGVNKIVADYDAAIQRIRDVAGPQNAKRLNYNTPCAKTGKCEDCSSPQRICNIISVLQKKPFGREFSVILVGQELGL